MVFKKSEYQNQFKSSVVSKNQSIYKENLTFRHERRDREFLHTPINWFNQDSDEVLSAEEETNQNSNCNISTSKVEKRSDEPQYQSLAEILDESKAKTIAFRQQRRVEDAHSKDLPDVLTLGKISLDDSSQKSKCLPDSSYGMDNTEELKDSVSKQNSLAVPENENASTKIDKEMYNQKKLKSKSNLRRKANSKKKSSNGPQPSHQRPQSAQGLKDDCCNQTNDLNGYQIPSLPISTRPRRPDRQRRAASGKSRLVSQSQERPPFVAYGAGDREETFTTHRTHNVRSTVDVYGAALKAKIRREEEKKRQLERQRRLAQSTNDILERLASATPRDMIDYRSEYQKQFHGYEPREYERSGCSRAVIPHSAPIRAVHRGASLIVHVD